MATFSYNVYSDESYASQYKRYLQNQYYVNDISETISHSGVQMRNVYKNQAKETERYIRESVNVHREAMEKSTAMITSSLHSGFEELSNSIGDMQSEIIGLKNIVGYWSSMIVHHQKIANKYLSNIKDLLRIPDSQLQRVYHIEEGIKFLLNADNQNNKQFYNFALDEFNKSINIESKDYISLYNLGFIYLKSIDHFNAAKAEEFFLKAATFFLAEYSVRQRVSSNNTLFKDKDFISEATEAYLYAAEACYLQQKYQDAVFWAAKAWECNPNLSKVGFYLAKYLVKSKQVSKAIEVLNVVLSEDRYISLYISSDIDLTTEPEVPLFIKKKTDEILQQVIPLYQQCLKVKSKRSEADNELNQLNILIKEGTFLAAHKAKDILLLAKERTMKQVALLDDGHRIKPNIGNRVYNGNLIEFLKIEKKSIDSYDEAKHLINIESIKSSILSYDLELDRLSNELSEKNKPIKELWSVFFYGLIIWGFSLAIATALGTVQGALLALLILLLAGIVYLGGGVLAIFLVYIVVQSIITWLDNQPLLRKISELRTKIDNYREKMKY